MLTSVEQQTLHIQAQRVSNKPEKVKFETEKQSFDITFIQFDHRQKAVSNLFFNAFVDAITKNYKQNPRPMCIVDICCGYGLQTKIVRQMLLNNGVEIKQMVGYDISKEMIEYAQKNYCFPQVRFQVKNIQTELNDFQEYDAGFCLYGIHWMNNTQQAIAAIQQSLKKGGLFSCQILLQDKDFFALRQNFVLHSKWSSAFDQSAKTLHSFWQSKDIYLGILNKYFGTLCQEQRTLTFKLDRDQFITCCQSWLQEVRHLTSEASHELKKIAIGHAYLSDLFDSIENSAGNSVTKEDGEVTQNYYFFDYDGIKK